MVERYRAEMSQGQERAFQHLSNFSKNRFSNDVATLVALLALSERMAKAEEIAADAKTVLPDEEFADLLKDALEGKVPDAWP
jgi:hypothetical protein